MEKFLLVIEQNPKHLRFHMPFGVEAPLWPDPKVDLYDGLRNRLERILHLYFRDVLAVFFELVNAVFVALASHQSDTVCVIRAL